MTLLIGSLFWGCVFAGILTGSLVGLIVFFFLWQGSLYFAQKFVVIAVGIFVIGVIRFAIMFAGRKAFFRSFYRKKPGQANIYFLALDWANFGLAAGFVFVRMMKLLVVSAFSVGRIDTDLLASGVGNVAGYEFDPFPTIHTRELMLHDAHRHPHCESLGIIYLMKLRHGTRFGNSAGSAFRLVFVYALMPWLQKYRVYDTPVEPKKEKDRIDIIEDDFSALALEQAAESPFELNERSSFLVAPALFKREGGNSVDPKYTSNLHLQTTITEIQMS